jgi:hypothetical protein
VFVKLKDNKIVSWFQSAQLHITLFYFDDIFPVTCPSLGHLHKTYSTVHRVYQVTETCGHRDKTTHGCVRMKPETILMSLKFTADCAALRAG